MARVKGSILVGFVTMIRADKSDVFNKYLTDEDRKIVSGRVLAMEWYPQETFMNCFKALFVERARGDKKVAWDWGRHFSDTYYQKVYKHLFRKTDPKTAMRNHEAMYKTLYDSLEMEVEEITGKESVAVIRSSEPLMEAYYHVLMGALERGLELVGAKDVKIEFLTRSWEGAPETRYKVSWAGWETDARVIDEMGAAVTELEL